MPDYNVLSMIITWLSMNNDGKSLDANIFECYSVSTAKIATSSPAVVDSHSASTILGVNIAKVAFECICIILHFF